MSKAKADFLYLFKISLIVNGILANHILETITQQTRNLFSFLSSSIIIQSI